MKINQKMIKCSQDVYLEGYNILLALFLPLLYRKKNLEKFCQTNPELFFGNVVYQQILV